MKKIEKRVYLVAKYIFKLSAVSCVTLILVCIHLRNNDIEATPFMIGAQISNGIIAFSAVLQQLMVLNATRFAIITKRKTRKGKAKDWHYCLNVIKDGMPIGRIIVVCHPLRLPEDIEAYIDLKKISLGPGEYRTKRLRPAKKQKPKDDTRKDGP